VAVDARAGVAVEVSVAATGFMVARATAPAALA
jgi:hypothetical protein